MDVVYIAGILACTGLTAALIRLCVRLSAIRQVRADAPVATSSAHAEGRQA